MEQYIIDKNTQLKHKDANDQEPTSSEVKKLFTAIN